MSTQPEPTPTPTPAKPRRQAEFEAVSDRERRNPFYRWLIHLGLPMGISLVVHVLLFAGMALKTWPVQAQREIEVGDYEAGLIESDEDRIMDAFQWDEQAALETPEVELDELNLDDWSRVDTVDETAFDESSMGEGEGDEGLGIGEGRLSLLGIGSGAGQAGEGGFGGGMGGRGGRLGQAGVWGLSIRANKIVYVVDFSGSIIVAVDDLKRELKRSIGDLRPTQAFNVIVFYSEGTGYAGRFKSDAFASKLQPALPETKRRFFTWLARKSPRGETEPLQSMKRAVNLRPEAIFFFSDGLFDDSVVTEITRANRAAQARIFCFLFDEIVLGYTGRIPQETDGSRRLARIARQNRGKMKIVTDADLRR